MSHSTLSTVLGLSALLSVSAQAPAGDPPAPEPAALAGVQQAIARVRASDAAAAERQAPAAAGVAACEDLEARVGELLQKVEGRISSGTVAQAGELPGCVVFECQTDGGKGQVWVVGPDGAEAVEAGSGPHVIRLGSGAGGGSGKAWAVSVDGGGSSVVVGPDGASMVTVDGDGVVRVGPRVAVRGAPATPGAPAAPRAPAAPTGFDAFGSVYTTGSGDTQALSDLGRELEELRDEVRTLAEQVRALRQELRGIPSDRPL